MMIKIDPIPGSAVSSASTTDRNRGTIENNRNTRNTLNARKTANGPANGINAMPTTTKSKMFHPFVKNRHRYANNFNPISTTKIQSASLSTNRIKIPARAITSFDVSSPSPTAFTTITNVMNR